MKGQSPYPTIYQNRQFQWLARVGGFYLYDGMMRNIALAGASLFLLAIPRPWHWSIAEFLTQTKKRNKVQFAGC